MGIHGLTTYLRENQRVLSKNLTLPSSSQQNIPLVVDGWSFIYELYRDSNLPWVFGGEYDQFCNTVCAVVRGWINIGFKIYFVFDGACPQLKFSTMVSRLGQSRVQPSLLFFRTSPASRGTARFLNETRILPPLSYTACLHALDSIRQSTDALEIHFADEEGDPYAVELAGRIEGYVVGNDSDFVVLNTEGYLGYIPLEEMIWHAPPPIESPAPEEDAEFQEFRKPKAKRRPVNDARVSRGIIPPESEAPTLSLTIYSPQALAEHLKIPVTLLPLLGALVGNDFSSQSESNRRNVQSLFFDRQLSLSQRINRVASTIQTILSPISQKRKKQKHQIGSVMDLIDRAVNMLLARLITTIGTGEVDDIVDKIVEATLQYAIPKHDMNQQNELWSSNVCALHQPDACTFLPLISRRVDSTVLDEDEGDAEESNELQDLITARTHYLDAYRQGRLGPIIMDILSSGTSWPRLFLENPDLETVSRSIGRPIREWGYSILHDAVGLPEVDEDSNEDIAEDPDEDELVDVVESDDDDSADDPLAPLKGELHRLHGSDDVGTASAASSHPLRPSRLPMVTEYIRRGTRVAQEAVAVKPLYELLSSISLSEPEIDDSTPFLLKPYEDRLTVFLRALECDLPSVRRLPSVQLIPVLTLRWVVGRTHSRAQESNSKEREKERWTRREARCFLASFDWTTSRQAPAAQEPTPIVDRHVQLMAQLLQALESIEHLSQILLLSDLPSPVHLLSGRTFHAYLTGTIALDPASVPSLLFEACSDGLDTAFSEGRVEKKRSKKFAKGKAKPVPNGSAKKLEGGGLFQLLADVDA
ncbi:Protein asteroid 1 [Hypsizygus marmoreus]|uniref:Protein asteroid 1 n=1 Tax=Hypsizygus marmoreus TaxID=39966 RepID=A0A369JW22_HYPMA|nr:Protein asteroid 1 [Hypsizygus marmoreus]